MRSDKGLNYSGDGGTEKDKYLGCGCHGHPSWRDHGGWGVCEDHVRASGGDIGKGGGDELSCGPRVRAVGCLGRGGSGDV